MSFKLFLWSITASVFLPVSAIAACPSYKDLAASDVPADSSGALLPMQKGRVTKIESVNTGFPLDNGTILYFSTATVGQTQLSCFKVLARPIDPSDATYNQTLRKIATLAMVLNYDFSSHLGQDGSKVNVTAYTGLGVSRPDF